MTIAPSPFDQYLYRTPYLVMPRLAIQAMSLDWQHRLLSLLEEANATGLKTPTYVVYRDDPKVTWVRKDGDGDLDVILEPLQLDPWADYRRGDVAALCPEFDRERAAASGPVEPDDRPIEIDYTNWRGERRRRPVTPIDIEFGCTSWHPKPQWLLRAIDDEDGAVKLFALSDIHGWDPPPVETHADDFVAQL